MAKYRKKPLIVEAEQFHHGATAPRGVRTRENGGCYVVTAQGREVDVSPGEWIIMEEDGIHAYPCSAADFERIYESADDSPQTPKRKFVDAGGFLIEAIDNIEVIR